MRRTNVFIGVAIAIAAGVGPGESVAQIETVSAPRFEFGLYAGGAVTGDWFNTILLVDGVEVDPVDESPGGDGPGLTAAFGGSATWYFLRELGVRAHYSYMPSEMPTPFDDVFDNEFDDLDDGYPLNIHVYDLNVVYRPWADQDDGILADTYVFAGGGAITSNPSGSEEEWGTCDSNLLLIGACLPMEADFGTVGQGVVGAGFNLFALGPFGVYTELALRAYDSPIHPVTLPMVNPLAAGVAIPVAEDRWAVTGGLVAGVSAALGDFDPIIPVVPVPSRPLPPPPPPPAAPQMRPISICVVQGGGLAMIEAQVHPATQDTVVSGQPFATRHPARAPEYGSGAPWFMNTDAARFNDAEFVKFGVTRIVPADQLVRAGEINGTSVFAARSDPAPHSVIYIPVRPGCEFQPYQLRQSVRPRG